MDILNGTFIRTGITDPQVRELTCSDEAFVNIDNGRETVTGRASKLADPSDGSFDYSDEFMQDYCRWNQGDAVIIRSMRFVPPFLRKINFVHQYQTAFPERTVRAMLKTEGWENMEPDAGSFEGAVKSYMNIPGYEERIDDSGIYAIGLEDMKIWPMQMPMEIFYTFVNLERPCEGRALGPEVQKNYQNMNRGDILAMYTPQEPDSAYLAWITYVNLYKTLDEMLVSVGLNAHVPGIESLDEARDLYLQFYIPERIQEHGMAAIGIGGQIPENLHLNLSGLKIMGYENNHE